ncbi:MAG TPA: VOC family protein [Vicinamibacterales bacterium]|jgi:PhnB protein|nr:VOC family protein [Vicinamibacterales bacterium]
MKLTPQISLAFNGQCEAAFRFYERCLNGSIRFILQWGNSAAAADAPSDWASKIYHATLEIGGSAIAGGDLPPDRYEQPRGFQIILQMDDAMAAERVFQSLAENGKIVMPLQETSWAARYGALIDQFGISWGINCEK